MIIEWEKAKRKYDYYYGKTGSKFSAQIGKSTEKGKFIWTISHDDFKYCIHGDSTDTIEQAKEEAENWLKENYNS